MGYIEKADRLRLLPWNVEMEVLLPLTPEEGLRFISEKLAEHQGEFICTLCTGGAFPGALLGSIIS